MPYGDKYYISFISSMIIYILLNLIITIEDVLGLKGCPVVIFERHKSHIQH